MRPRHPARIHSSFLVHSDVIRPLAPPSAPRPVANIPSSLPGEPLGQWRDIHPAYPPSSSATSLCSDLYLCWRSPDTVHPSIPYHPIDLVTDSDTSTTPHQTTASLHTKWTFLTLGRSYHSKGMYFLTLEPFRTDCSPSLELGSRSHRHPVQLVILNGLCAD